MRRKPWEIALDLLNPILMLAIPVAAAIAALVWVWLN